MKSSFILLRLCVIFLATLLLLISNAIEGHRIAPGIPMGSKNSGSLSVEKLPADQEGGNEGFMEIHATGSTLPDCSHACGPCFPCRRVMVSFECSVAESCPIVYRCMCRGRYYHVPSN